MFFQLLAFIALNKLIDPLKFITQLRKTLIFDSFIDLSQAK